MAENKKISDLPNDTAVTLADYIPIITPGGAQTKKASLASILTLAGSGSGGSGSSTPAVFLNTFQVSLPENKTGIPNGTTVSAGDPIAPFLEAAFRQASPAHYTPASLTLSASPAPAVIEIGKSISPTFTITYTAHDAGAEISRVLNKNGSALTPAGGVYSDTITVGTSAISYRATVNYAQGPVNNDSLGNPDPSGRIGAGPIDSNILSYQGFYKLWYDAVASAPSTSSAARALSNSRYSNSGNSFTLNTGSTQSKFVLLLPPGKTLVSVIDQDALNLDITAQYTSGSISVNDAGGNSVPYTIYTMSQSIPYTSNHRHNITIA